MKKTIGLLTAMLAALAMVCLSAGCSGEEQPAGSAGQDQSQTAVEEQVLEGVYADITALGVLPEMYMVDDAYVEGYYGIASDMLSDKVFAVAYDSLLADTVIIVKVSETGDAEAIAESFRTINTQRLAEMESYNPTQYQRASEAVIEVSGDYAYYVITDDNAAVTGIIENSIG